MITYDLYMNECYIGTYTSKGIAYKLDRSPSCVTKAALHDLTICGKYKVRKSNKPVTEDEQDLRFQRKSKPLPPKKKEERKEIIKKQRRLKIVGSEHTRKTSSAGRTYCLPEWKEI